MRYAQIREMDVSNGSGIGVALFVQGCHFHCKGCFNQETWDFSGGKEWTPAIEEEFIKLANAPYIKRISILGGEPLCDENVTDVLMLIKRLRGIFGNSRKIWVYSGYTFEDVYMSTNKTIYDCKRISLFNSIDILVDGQFQLSKQDLSNKVVKYAGSTNQRVIDMRNTLKSNKIVLLDR